MIDLIKCPLDVNSTTQSNCQHRFRVTAVACLADLPGRYPYESAWNIGSSFGSMICLTTVCAIRSDTVGIPSFLVPPFAFGISTCFTGGGKYGSVASVVSGSGRVYR